MSYNHLSCIAMKGSRAITLRQLTAQRARPEHLPRSTPRAISSLAPASAARQAVPIFAPSHVASAGNVRYYSTQHAGPSTLPIPAISQENTYDIVIIGAANAGLALACALRVSMICLKDTNIELTSQWTSLVCVLGVEYCYWTEGVWIRSGRGMVKGSGRIVSLP